jgi:hypothetical protein
MFSLAIIDHAAQSNLQGEKKVVTSISSCRIAYILSPNVILTPKAKDIYQWRPGWRDGPQFGESCTPDDLQRDNKYIEH